MGILMAAKPKVLSYNDMVLQAVLNIKDYIKGASRQAIKKYIEVTFNKVVSLPAFRSALKKLVDNGSLLQDGQRFKLEKGKRAELRKPPPKPKKKKVVKKKPKTKKKKKKATKKKKKTTKKKATKKKKKTTKKKPQRRRSQLRRSQLRRSQQRKSP